MNEDQQNEQQPAVPSGAGPMPPQQTMPPQQAIPAEQPVQTVQPSGVPVQPQQQMTPPVQQVDSSQQMQNYSNNTVGVKSSKRTLYMVLAGVITLLVIVGGAVALLSGPKENESAKETSTSEAEQSVPTQSIPEVTARNDISRKNDLNNIYTKLEEHYSAEGFYPGGKLSADILAGINPDALTDSAGKVVNQIAPTMDTAPPSNPYKAGTKPSIAEYTYAPYDCMNQGTQTMCSKYVLYGWFENDTLYVRTSLN